MLCSLKNANRGHDQNSTALHATQRLKASSHRIEKEGKLVEVFNPISCMDYSLRLRM